MNPDIDGVDDPLADALLSSLRTISAPERRRHASVYNYWLTIRRDRQFPPIHDLDPLEISDAGAFSVLLEMIGGGEDAEIRHVGQEIKAEPDVAKIGEAPNPSLLSCIAARLPVVAASRDAFAFEDEFEGADGKTRCWVTLLPFSATGTWIDFVYGFVSLDPPLGAAAAAEDADPAEAADEPGAELEEGAETSATPVELEAGEAQPEPTMAEKVPAPGFSAKFFESLARVGGFYGTPVDMNMDAFGVVAPDEAEEPSADDPPVEEAVADEAETNEVPPGEPATAEAELVPDEPAIEITSTLEASLETKLTEVRAKADEARQAKLRANSALYEGLSAAYDFALDAEDSPEDYLKLVQAEGLKIQLRSPMKPVAKLAFHGMCDEAAIEQLEAILAWAFEEELPRGTLAQRIEAEGGIGSILNGQAKAA
jgi:hypothetical protein